MATETIREFVAKIGYETDEPSENRFLNSMRGAVLQANVLSDAIQDMARIVADKVGEVGRQFEQTAYMAARVGSSSNEIRSFAYAASQMGSSVGEATDTLEKFGRYLRLTPLARDFIENTLHIKTAINGVDRSSADLLKNIGGTLAHSQPYLANKFREMFGMVSEPLLFALENQAKFDQFFQEKQKSQADAGIGPEADKVAIAYEQTWRSVWSQIDDRANATAINIEKYMNGPLAQLDKWIQESDKAERKFWGIFNPGVDPTPFFRSLNPISPAEGEELIPGGKGITVDGSAVSSSNPLPVSVKDVNGATDGGGSWWDRIRSFFGGGSASSGVRAGVGPSGLGPGSGGRGGGAEAGGATASAGTFMDALAQIESTNRNIHSTVDPDPPGFPGGNSQGYFQINTPTWRDFAPRAGVDLSQYPNAMSAPRDIQALVAAQIPLSRFGGRTRAMLRGRFGALSDRDTIGQLAAAHGGTAAPGAGQTNGRYPGRTIPRNIPSWANPYDTIFDSDHTDPSQKAHAKGVNWDFSDPNAAALGRAASIDTSKTLSSNVTNTINVTSTDPHEAAAMVALHLDRTAHDVTRNLQGAAQ